MFHVSKNEIITLTRGDTAIFDLSLVLGCDFSKDLFDFQEGDIVKFRVLFPNSKFEDAVIKKDLTYADLDETKSLIKIAFESEDTKWLDAGTYYYEVKLYYTRDNTNYVDTIVQRTKFYLIN